MLSTTEARAVITTSLSDSDLEDVIAREEAWLARRVGPLEGERVETFVATDGDETLRLTRPTSLVDVTDDSGAKTDYELRGWSDLVLPSTAAPWNGDVLVTYSTDDEEEVKRALLTLVRLALNESAYAAEAASGYSVASDYVAQKSMRFTAWRGLLRDRTPGTTRLRSAIPSGGRSIGAVATDAAAS